jgi:signal peptidase II
MSRYLLFSVSLLVVLFDQWTKNLIATRIPLYDSISVIRNFFDITHTHNTGVAFSVLADASSPWVPRILSTVTLLTLCAILFVLLRYPNLNPALQTGLFLILGGAAGNLFDRIRQGFIIDFLDVYIGPYHWPTFNIADSAITIGIGLLLWNQWWRRPSPEKK